VNFCEGDRVIFAFACERSWGIDVKTKAFEAKLSHENIQVLDCSYQRQLPHGMMMRNRLIVVEKQFLLGGS